MPEKRTLVGYDLAELRPSLTRQHVRRRQRRLLYVPASPSPWIFLASFLAIVALEYGAALALDWWLTR